MMQRLCLTLLMAVLLTNPLLAQAQAASHDGAPRFTGALTQRSSNPSLTVSPTLQRILDLTNHARSKAGLRQLTFSPALMSAAARHTETMARWGRITHTGAGGSSVGGRISRAGYGWLLCAENVAAGYTSADAVFRGWMNSPGHRANLLHPRARHIGLGYEYRADDPSKLRHYWTMVVAAPR